MVLAHPWPIAGVPPLRFVKKGRPFHARLPVIELPLDGKPDDAMNAYPPARDSLPRPSLIA